MNSFMRYKVLPIRIQNIKYKNRVRVQVISPVV